MKTWDGFDVIKRKRLKVNVPRLILMKKHREKNKFADGINLGIISSNLSDKIVIPKY